jgi:hypothetical protein
VLVIILLQLYSLQACLPTECGPGAYSSGGLCQNCTVGSCNDKCTLSSCTACNPGFYEPFSGCVTASCPQCPAATFSNLTGGSFCYQCPAGKYGNTAGRTTFSAACSDCSVGTFTAAAGMTQCSFCPFAKFQISAGQSFFNSCGGGNYLSYSGTSPNCNNSCSLGSNAVDPATTCVDCKAGEYFLNTSTPCSSCPSGSYNTAPRLSYCDLCLPGFSTTGSNSTTCKICSVGKYADINGTSSCVRCLSGFFSASQGSTECDQCSSGTYSTSWEHHFAKTVHLDIMHKSMLPAVRSVPLEQYLQQGRLRAQTV